MGHYYSLYICKKKEKKNAKVRIKTKSLRRGMINSLKDTRDNLRNKTPFVRNFKSRKK